MERPVPVIDDTSRAYWEAARNHRLVIARCDDCGTYAHPPTEICARCAGAAFSAVETNGRGRVYSWSVMHSGGNPGFEERLPYTVLVVELDELPGVRTIGNLVGADPSELRIGAALEVTWEQLSDDITLPQWQLESGGAP